jgi:ferredoxin--NADP+ reductase
MVDGTGMCGCCRVSIDSKILFTCVDGPEFDGQKVDWNELMNRLKQYKTEENKSSEKYLSEVGEHPWL